MSFKDLLRDTLQTLWSHKLRTLLTMFGIAWGIISIILMVGAGEGLRVGQARVSAGFGKNIMIVFAGRTSLQAGGMRAGRKVMWHARITSLSRNNRPLVRKFCPNWAQILQFEAPITAVLLWSPDLSHHSPRFEVFLPLTDASTTGMTSVKPVAWRFLGRT
jgi:ABC-type antimicrobial peptide transport system permease subunit